MRERWKKRGVIGLSTVRGLQSVGRTAETAMQSLELRAMVAKLKRKAEAQPAGKAAKK